MTADCRLNSDTGWALKVPFAGVAELVDARDLGSRGESRGGSSPSARTTPDQKAPRPEIGSPDRSPHDAAARDM